MRSKRVLKIFVRCSRFTIVFLLAFGWVFSGWPQIYGFPPDIQKANAAGCTTAALATGTDPAATTIAPESAIADSGQFTITGNGTSCTVKVTALTVTLAAAGTPYNGLAEVRITSSDGSTTYYSAVTSFSSNNVSFSGGTEIPIAKASTGAVTFKIMVTPKTHANMDPVPGASYDIAPYVSSWTTTLTKSGSDTNPNTTTIDNTSPVGATSPSISAGNAKVTLGWTSTSGETSTSTILRWAAASAAGEVPTEGATYAAGDAIAPTATVACVFAALTTATAKSGIIDGSGGTAGCTTSALTNGQAYTYTIFQQDAYGNYDAGTSIGSATPVTVPDAPTIGTATAGNTQASVAFTPPASDGGSAITGYTVTSTPGSFTGTGAGSPIVVTGLTNGTAYTFTVHATNAIGNSSESSASNSVTPAAIPTVTTSDATSVTATTAVFNGNITATGGVNATVRGFAWGTNSLLSGGDTATTTNDTGSFGIAAFNTNPSPFTGLTCGTTYYSRAYATNSGGTGLGGISNLFTTSACVYSISISPAGNIEYGYVALSAASSTVGSTYTKTATNDSSTGTTEKISVKSSNATNGTGWTLASTIGANQFKHEFSTTTGTRWDFMPDSATYVTAKPSVAVDGTVAFDFRLTAPSSSDYVQKSITITVLAEVP